MKKQLEGTKQFNFKLSKKLMSDAQEKANKEGFNGNRTKFVDYVLRQYIEQNDKLTIINEKLSSILKSLKAIKPKLETTLTDRSN